MYVNQWSSWRAVFSGFAIFVAVVVGVVGIGCGGARTEAVESGGSSGTHVVRVGDRAPDFMLQDHSGRVRQLSEYRRHPLVLYFYPRDATPGCTAEACAFRDAWAQLQSTGAIVVGVSTDDVASHQAFRTEHDLPFDLLADVDGRIAEQYGVPMRMGMAMRVTFLIDGDGIVRRVFEDVDPAVHVDEVIAAIQALPESEGGGTGTIP